MRLEAAPGLQFLCEGDKLTDRPDLPVAIRGIWIAKEQVRGERNSIPEPPAQNFRNGSTPGLPEEVEASEFERGEYLNMIVVKRGRGIADAEP